jgi:hypothetical protein
MPVSGYRFKDGRISTVVFLMYPLLVYLHKNSCQPGTKIYAGFSKVPVW